MSKPWDIIEKVLRDRQQKAEGYKKIYKTDPYQLKYVLDFFNKTPADRLFNK